MYKVRMFVKHGLIISESFLSVTWDQKPQIIPIHRLGILLHFYLNISKYLINSLLVIPSAIFFSALTHYKSIISCVFTFLIFLCLHFFLLILCGTLLLSMKLSTISVNVTSVATNNETFITGHSGLFSRFSQWPKLCHNYSFGLKGICHWGL